MKRLSGGAGETDIRQEESARALMQTMNETVVTRSSNIVFDTYPDNIFVLI